MSVPVHFDHNDTTTINGMNVRYPREVEGHEPGRDRWGVQHVAGRQRGTQSLGVDHVGCKPSAAAIECLKCVMLARAPGTTQTMHARA